MRRRSALRWAWLAGGPALVFTACFSSHGPVDVPFPSPGAALPDVASGAPDAAGDAGREVSLADAPAWDGDVPLPGEWLPIPGLPAACGVRIAKDPRVSVSRLPWVACANGRTGCEVFLADWGAVDGSRFRPERIEAAFQDGAGVHLTYSRSFGNQTAHRQTVTQLLHGDAEVSFFSTGTCSVGRASRTRHGLGLSVLHGEDTPSASVTSYLGWSEAMTPLKLRIVPASLTPALNIVQGVARGDGFLTTESTNFGGAIVSSAFLLANETYVPSTPDRALLTEYPLPTEGGYVSLVASDPSVLAFMPLTGGYRPIVRPAAGSFVNGFRLDRARSDALVWGEAEITDDQRRTFWTSPFANTEGGIVRRPIARLTHEARFIANAGVIALVADQKTARILRTSDGLGWDIPVEPGLDFVEPIWVNDDAAWFVISKPNPPAIALLSSGAMRVDRASLGAPTVPNGL